MPSRKILAAERASGKTWAQAAQAAGYSEGRNGTTRASTDVNVLTQVSALEAEIIERTLERAVLTKADVLAELHSTYLASREGAERTVVTRDGPIVDRVPDYKAAVRALELYGRELGMFGSRLDIRMIHAIAAAQGLDADELIAEAESLQRAAQREQRKLAQG